MPPTPAVDSCFIAGARASSLREAAATGCGRSASNEVRPMVSRPSIQQCCGALRLVTHGVDALQAPIEVRELFARDRAARWWWSGLVVETVAVRRFGRILLIDSSGPGLGLGLGLGLCRACIIVA
ncbi:hypothetical protein L1887_59196 [Cichorium endivia]|nr:hypothetical protein L1887_59196 [Cichorium endivia]